MDILVNHFISSHVTEARDPEADYITQAAEDKASKRKSREILYEGDARYVLPMMYVANMYETLVNEVNMKLSSVNGMREKSIGVPLEAAGGLYRKLAKKFPKKGVMCVCVCVLDCQVFTLEIMIIKSMIHSVVYNHFFVGLLVTYILYFTEFRIN